MDVQKGCDHYVVGSAVVLQGKRYMLSSPAHSDVASYLLRTQWMTYARCFHRFGPRQPQPMAPGQCYRNARILAQRNPQEFHFVEGVFGKFLRGDPGTIAVCGHAWCVDRHGRIVEPTVLPGEARFYYGVPVPHRHLTAIEDKPFVVDAHVQRVRWREFEKWILPTMKAPPTDVTDPAGWIFGRNH